MLGFLMPTEVHVADVHGLADPVASRFELESRGRPGHEKKLSAAWQLARFAEPTDEDDAAVTAARHALHCGELASLTSAVRDPLSFHGFVENLRAAWRRSHLRIPPDPFDAETRFCHTPSMMSRTAGGGGGTRFRWRCPAGEVLYGVRGALKPKDAALAYVQPLCRGDAVAVVGPQFGESSDSSFEVACPTDTGATSLYGTSDNLVRSVGLVCSKPDTSWKTSVGGVESGRPFRLACPGSGRILGLEGRTGSLVDSVGVLCAR
jgi:hypothetical protein